MHSTSRFQYVTSRVRWSYHGRPQAMQPNVWLEERPLCHVMPCVVHDAAAVSALVTMTYIQYIPFIPPGHASMCACAYRNRTTFIWFHHDYLVQLESGPRSATDTVGIPRPLRALKPDQHIDVSCLIRQICLGWLILPWPHICSLYLFIFACCQILWKTFPQ